MIIIIVIIIIIIIIMKSTKVQTLLTNLFALIFIIVSIEFSNNSPYYYSLEWKCPFIVITSFSISVIIIQKWCDENVAITGWAIMVYR